MNLLVLRELMENQSTSRKYGSLFRLSFEKHSIIIVLIFLPFQFHANYFWSLLAIFFQAITGEDSAVRQGVSKRMSLAIGARRHLERGHEKHIMDTIQSHPTQVFISVSFFILFLLDYNSCYMSVDDVSLEYRLYKWSSAVWNDSLIFQSYFKSVGTHSDLCFDFLILFQAALGGSVGNLQRIRAFLRVSVKLCRALYGSYVQKAI